MAENDKSLISKIFYYGYTRFYHHMYTLASDGLHKYVNDPILQFFAASALVFEDRLQEGMRQLELFVNHRDLNLAAIITLLYAHRKHKNVDEESVSTLDNQLKSNRRQAGERALYHAGFILCICGKHDKAREYIDRMLKMDASNHDGLSLKGWNDLLSGKKQFAGKASKFFDDVLRQDPDHFMALLGKAHYFRTKENFTGAQEVLNRIIVKETDFMPSLIEKMNISLASHDWEQIKEDAQRCIEQDAHCIEAKRVVIINELCREGNYEKASDGIGQLQGEMEQFEPHNGHLFSYSAALFARLCGRHDSILQRTCAMADRALECMNKDLIPADLYVELGYQYLMQDKVKEAMKYFRAAMNRDDSSIDAMCGIIECQLLEGHLTDASQQLEFLHEVKQTIGSNARLLYLNAVLARNQENAPEKTISFLDEATDNHLASIQLMSGGIDYFHDLNPDFLILIVSEYLKFAPQQPKTAKEAIHPVLKQCAKLMEMVTRLIPGLHDGLFLMAKVRYLSGNIDSAKGVLQHCIEKLPSFSDAHILMAQILLSSGNYQEASQSLEVALSYNFSIREHPLFHLIKARIAKKKGDFDEAARLLTTALTLPGVRRSPSSGKRAAAIKSKVEINASDRVSVFLELAEAHRHLGHQHEAVMVMQDATNEFQGTPDENRVMIANSEIALMNGDVENAIGQLRNISEKQAYFVEARQKMAEIFLKYRKDKRLYAGCYKELAEKFPSTHTQLLLGDAYMDIQEPEKAIAIYEQSLKRNPRDPQLASKIGKALVRTHHYGKAINYYEAALRSGGQSFLRRDLADLLILLRQYDKAEKVLREALEQREQSPGNLQQLMDKAIYTVMLAKVHRLRGSVESARQALGNAKEIQSRVLKRALLERPEELSAQRQLAVSICSSLAEIAKDGRDYAQAIAFYNEALTFGESTGKTMKELAELYMLTGDLDSCENTCMSMLKNDQENDAATLMLADLMFQKNDYDSALVHFKNLLQNNPTHYNALCRLIDLMQRSGRLEEASEYLDAALHCPNTRAELDGGYNFCKGLYEWRSGNTTDALKFMNKARRDSEWGYKALLVMIEICLNPDNNTLGGEVFRGMEDSASMQSKESDQMALHTAERLLKELKSEQPNDTRPAILQAMWLVSTKNKGNVDKAIQTFGSVLANERDHVGAIYGMAVAQMVLKDNKKAKTQLKMVSKATWNNEEGDTLEKCWLLLADIMIQANNYSAAKEQLEKCIAHNKSCCKAYEYLGHINEKEQQFVDASKNYELAWQFSNKNNPNIGFKLAFNCLKAKKYTNAIDICHHVLKTHPNYPKIQREILDKARASLRT